MSDYYMSFMEKSTLGGEGTRFLTECGTQLLTDHKQELDRLVALYFDSDFDEGAIEPEASALAARTGIHPYTVAFVFYVRASARLLPDFLKKGYSRELFDDTFADLFYKAADCQRRYGIYGIKASSWYKLFFSMTVFKLGRLQFQLNTYWPDKPFEIGGITVRQGDPVVAVHIPSSCGPLTREAREDSYKRAYEFFADRRKDGKLIMTCYSWLMYDKTREIFPPQSNIADFFTDFDIVFSKEEPNYPSCHCLFDTDYHGAPDALPAKSSAQRAMRAWLKAGKNAGVGFGIRVQDKS